MFVTDPSPPPSSPKFGDFPFGTGSFGRNPPEGYPVPLWGVTGFGGQYCNQSSIPATGCSAFSAAAFGQSSTLAYDYGTPSTSAFGQSSAPSFGFGRPSAPASSSFGFGQSSTATFGQSSTPAFGFGQLSTPAFGQTSTPASGFGQSSTPTFGQSSSTPAFDFGPPTAPPVGQSNKPALGFGRPSAPAIPSFGLGQSSTPTFGQSSTPAFGFGQASTPAFGQTDYGSLDASVLQSVFREIETSKRSADTRASATLDILQQLLARLTAVESLLVCNTSTAGAEAVQSESVNKPPADSSRAESDPESQQQQAEEAEHQQKETNLVLTGFEVAPDMSDTQITEAVKQLLEANTTAVFKLIAATPFDWAEDKQGAIRLDFESLQHKENALSAASKLVLQQIWLTDDLTDLQQHQRQALSDVCAQLLQCKLHPIWQGGKLICQEHNELKTYTAEQVVDSGPVLTKTRSSPQFRVTCSVATSANDVPALSTQDNGVALFATASGNAELPPDSVT